MDEIRKKAKQDYMQDMKYKDIAKKHDVSLNTVKSWVTRYGWAKIKKGAHKNKKGAHKKDSTHIDKTQGEKTTKKVIKEVIANEELTDKQQLFCIYYLKYFNATKAYQKAYGCNYLTANVNGSRLLVNASIKQQIEKLKSEQMKGIYIDGKAILQKYIDIAFADITDYIEFGQEEIQLFDKDGSPRVDENGDPVKMIKNYARFKNSDNVDGTIIKEVSQGKDGAKVKLYDKMKALDWLSENLYKYKEGKDLDKELMETKIEKEKAQVKKLQKGLDSNADKPIEINIIPKAKRVGED